MEIKKVLLLGASGSGKTTALEHIDHDENIKILSFDYGKAIIGDNSTYLFSSPGLEGFKFMQDVLSDDIDGIVIFIDNIKGITETDAEIMDYIDKKHIPYVIFANKQDLSNSILKIDFDVLIILTIATEGIGINDGLKMLLKLIETKKQAGKDFKDIIKGFKPEKKENAEKPDFKDVVKDIEPSEICKLKLFMHPIELENIKEALENVGFSNITIIEVGYIDDHAITRESYRGSNYSANIPQRMEINLIIKREDIKFVIQAIKTIKTEDISDDVFISPIENVVRIRTEERGEEAVE